GVFPMAHRKSQTSGWDLRRNQCHRQARAEGRWSGGDWATSGFVFAFNLYDWKDLGRTAGQPVRGCAGFYWRKDCLPPATATRRRGTASVIRNLDQLDPFAP